VVTEAAVEPHRGKAARKTFGLKADGTPKTTDYSLGTRFILRRRAVMGHEGLVALARDMERDGERFLLRGRAITSSPILLQPRLWRDRPDQPATLEDAASRLFTGDIDKMPNLCGLDPRVDPHGTAAWMLAQLGPEFARCAAVVIFSGSCCLDLPEGQPPATLSARVLILMDEELDHDGLKAIHLAMDARLVAALPEGARPGAGAMIVDWHVAMPMQPIYLAAPRFLPGRSDPFGGRTRVVSLAAGRDPLLHVAALRDALPQAVPPVAAARTSRRKAEADNDNDNAPRVVQPVPARAPLPLVPVERPALDPLFEAMCRGVMERRSAARGWGGELAVKSHRGVGMMRAAAEALHAIHARVRWGADHAAFADWARAGHVPPGQRDTWTFVISSLVAAAADVGEIEDGRVAEVVAWIARTVGGEDWAREEWEGRADGALFDRCRDAAEGKVVEWMGRSWDPRYGYNLDTVIELLSIGQDEALALGMISLAPTEWIAALGHRRAEAQARGEVHRTALEALMERAAMQRRIMAVRRDRRTVPALSARFMREGTEVSRSTIRRLLEGPRIDVPKVDFVVAGVGFRGGAAFQPRRFNYTPASAGRAEQGQGADGEADVIAALGTRAGEDLPLHDGEGDAVMGNPVPAAGASEMAGRFPEGEGEAGKGILTPAAHGGDEEASIVPVVRAGEGTAGFLIPTEGITAGILVPRDEPEGTEAGILVPSVHGDRGTVIRPPVVAVRPGNVVPPSRLIAAGDWAALASTLVEDLHAEALRLGADRLASLGLMLPAGSLLDLDHPMAQPIAEAWQALRPGTEVPRAARLGGEGPLVHAGVVPVPPQRLVPLSSSQRDRLLGPDRPSVPSYTPFRPGRVRGDSYVPALVSPSLVKAWARVDAAWGAAWAVMAGEDDGAIRDALVRALEASAKAVRAKGATLEDAPPDDLIMRLPLGAFLDGVHPMAEAVHAAMRKVHEAKRAVAARDRKRGAKHARMAFGIMLADLTGEDALRHVARRSLAARDWREDRIRKLVSATSRQSRQPVRLRDVPEAHTLHRALSAVLRADRAEVAAAGLPEDLRRRCLAMLQTDLSREVRQEMHRLAGGMVSAPRRVSPRAAAWLVQNTFYHAMVESWERARPSQAHLYPTRYPAFMKARMVAAPAVD